MKRQLTPYLASRSLPVALAGTPASLDESSRSVEVCASTETPAWVMDWERWELVPEVLLMSGCQLPPGGQLPLLDAHSRDSVQRVLGSFREAHIADTQYGPGLVGRACFSQVAEADAAWTLVREGHLTDVSIGYEVTAHVWIDEGQAATIEGKSYTGPLRVGTEWRPRELSVCPIGADENAKFRAQHQTPAGRAGRKTEKSMSDKTAGGARAAREEEAKPMSEKKRGLLARLRAILGRDDPADDEQVDVTLTDESGDPVSPEELSEEQLIAVVEGLDEELTAAEQALAEVAGEEPEDAAREEEVPEEEQRGGRGSGKRALTPAQAVRAERARVQAIQTMARAHNLPEDMTQKLISSGVGLTRAKAQVLDMQSKNATTGPGFHISAGTTEKEKVRAALQDALALRCGVTLEKPAPGADELRGFSLREMCRELLGRQGQRVSGSPVELVGRALATTDLPKLLVETSRRVLMDAYETQPETWRAWCQTGVATDFKKSTAIGLEGDVKPLLKPEGGEYQDGRFAEMAEEYTVKTYGRKMTITREAIINDDLQALTALPRLYGEQAAVLVGDVAYAALLNAPVMGDGKALFHADHHNLFSGQGGAPTVAKLDTVCAGMKLQKDSLGNRIGVAPKFFIAPVALEGACEQFFNTQLQGAPIVGTQAAPLVHNRYGGTFFTRVYDARLDDVSASNWYLAAARGTVTVFFLGGVESPYIEEEIDFNTDGVTSKVRMDVGAKAMRWATLAKAL